MKDCVLASLSAMLGYEEASIHGHLLVLKQEKEPNDTHD